MFRCFLFVFYLAYNSRWASTLELCGVLLYKRGSLRKKYSVISRYKPWATVAIVLELLEVAGRTPAGRKHRRSLRKGLMRGILPCLARFKLDVIGDPKLHETYAGVWFCCVGLM